MPPNFTVALIGDQGLGANARAVLRMIKEEGADMALHSGDFAYRERYGDGSDLWDQMINETLGEDFPYFGSIGNHETRVWDAYQKKLQERLSRISGAECTGDLGVNSYCTYKGCSLCFPAWALLTLAALPSSKKPWPPRRLRNPSGESAHGTGTSG